LNLGALKVAVSQHGYGNVKKAIDKALERNKPNMIYINGGLIMWVRNQNKHKLLDIKAFQVIEGTIEGISADGEGWTLGKYSTKERALEVLDQIQERLTEGYGSDVIVGGTRVYRENVFEMPEE